MLDIVLHVRIVSDDLRLMGLLVYVRVVSDDLRLMGLLLFHFCTPTSTHQPPPQL